MTCCVSCRSTEAACDQRGRCCDRCDHDDNTVHRITRYLDATGWRASCCCGWRTTCQTRERRDGQADAHTP